MTEDAFVEAFIVNIAPQTVSGTGPGHCPDGGPAVHGVVAVVTDTGPEAAARNLQATITWGDGHNSAGTLLTNADGTFSVRGTNTYARAGAYALAMTIQDPLHHQTVSATGTASVSPPRGSLSAAGLVVRATTAQPFRGVVAVVDDTDSSIPPRAGCWPPSPGATAAARPAR
jgi:hypothetical protein